MSLSSLLNDTLTLRRKSTARDESGGAVNAWSDVGTYPATFQPVSDRERYAISQRGVWYTHHAYLDRDISATVRDQVVQGSTGLVFNVKHVFDMAGRDRAYRIGLAEQT